LLIVLSLPIWVGGASAFVLNKNGATEHTAGRHTATRARETERALTLGRGGETARRVMARGAVRPRGY
jgi:hypothetical protein